MSAADLGSGSPPPAVPPALEGERVDRAVALLLGCSRSAATALVEGGSVRVAGERVCSPARRLRAGEALEIDLVGAARPPAGLEADPTVPFAVRYEDDDLVVVSKPRGVVVHPGAGRRSGTLVAGLLARYPEIGRLPAAGAGTEDRPGIVHRLDKDTSGLLVVARTPEAYHGLVRSLAQRRVRRVYRALVRGRVAADEGVVDAPIGRAVADRTRMAVRDNGREARTRYRVLRRLEAGSATELELELETGRTHQIRVHLAAIGYPVLGDTRYGGIAGPGGATRTMLHATRLELPHPRSSEVLICEDPLPQDYQEVLARLGGEGDSSA